MTKTTKCIVKGCKRDRYGRSRYCGPHGHRKKRYGDPLAGSTFQGEPRAYLENLVGTEKQECIPWPYNKNVDGYGVLKIDGDQSYANRFMCRLAHGEPPTDKHEAAHTCGKGHEACVNPNHLYWGTRADNAKDMVRHGASCAGDRSARRKLSSSDVLEIRERLKAGAVPMSLAIEYGVGRGTIYRIKHKATWACLWGRGD